MSGIRIQMKTQLLAVMASVAFFGGVSPGAAATVTLTMDEVPNQPINGLSVTKGGETFTFADPGQRLFYNSIGPGAVTYVQDPSIQGFTEPFAVTFSQPVTSISFGLAESSLLPLSGAQVLLSNGSTYSFDLSLTDPFAEGQFSWSGAPVTGFSLTPVSAAGAIAFDNLTVSTSTVPGPVPGAGLLSLAFFILMGVAAKARQTFASC